MPAIVQALLSEDWVVTLSPEDELRLVARLKSRDEAAFNSFVRMFEQKVFHLVHRMLGNRAEAQDLAQEVFVTIFKSIDSFREESKLSTWIYRIAINHCKNRIKYLDRRSTRAHGEITEINEPDVADGSEVGGRPARPDEAAEGNEMQSAVQRALRTLEEEYRLLIVLRDLEGLPYEDIVKLTGLPDGTVKSRLHRARNALREAIERGVGWKLNV